MNSFSDTFGLYIIPLLKAVVLFMLACLLFYLIKLINNLSNTLNKTHKTIDLVDTSIEKIQTPLETAQKISLTVDKAHDVTVGAVNSAKDFIVKNVDLIKSKIASDDDDYDDISE